MNERQLEYVVAIVEEGTFTKAAQRCSVSQPSLSASVSRLERELGVQLFHRVGRSTTPTDACEALLPSARDAIRAVDGARAAARGVRAGISGRLHLAIQPTVQSIVLPVVAGYRRQHPGVTMRLVSPSEDPVTELVASGAAELGIGDVVADGHLVWTPLWTERYVLVARGPVASVGRTPLDLTEVELVAPPPGSATRNVIDRWFGDAGIRPRIVIEADHREALLPLVAVGGLATIVPASMVAGEGAPRLESAVLDPPVERRIGIARRPGPLTPAAQGFLDLVADAVQVAP